MLQEKSNSYSKNIYWVFGILLKKNSKFHRNNVMRKLLKYNIDTRPFFLSMNKQSIFKKLKVFKKIKKSNHLNRLVTLSPLTEMATEFHSKNGAKLLQVNETTQNFEYKIIK